MLKRLVKALYRTPWGTVTGSFLVMVIGSGPVVYVAFSFFMPALLETFSWSRGTLSMGIVMHSLMGALGMPLFGRIIDRYGLRRSTLIAVGLFCSVLASASLMPSVEWVFLVVYGCLGFFGVSLTPLPYTKAVSAVFDHRRGLALGISMAGYGVGAALISILASYLIVTVGWRNAYWILSLLVFVVAFISLTLLISEPKITKKDQANNIVLQEQGLTVREALTDSKSFWIIAFSLLLISVAINGVVTHFVMMTTDRGMLPIKAASLLGVLGVSSIVGRLLTGYLIDRFFAPRVAAILFILPLVGVVLLALNIPNQYIFISAFTLGVGLGAEVDVMGYVVGRYFGMRSFAEIYGYLLAVFTLGAGAGSFLLGVYFDYYQSYIGALWLVSAGIVLAILAFLCLAQYRYPPSMNKK